MFFNCTQWLLKHLTSFFLLQVLSNFSGRCRQWKAMACVVLPYLSRTFATVSSCCYRFFVTKLLLWHYIKVTILSCSIWTLLRIWSQSLGSQPAGCKTSGRLPLLSAVPAYILTATEYHCLWLVSYQIILPGYRHGEQLVRNHYTTTESLQRVH